MSTTSLPRSIFLCRSEASEVILEMLKVLKKCWNTEKQLRRLHFSWALQLLNYKQVLNSSFRCNAWWLWKLWASGLGSKALSWKVLSNARVKMSTTQSLEPALWPVLCQGLPSSWIVSLNHETVLKRRPAKSPIQHTSSNVKKNAFCEEGPFWPRQCMYASLYVMYLH